MNKEQLLFHYHNNFIVAINKCLFLMDETPTNNVSVQIPISSNAEFNDMIFLIEIFCDSLNNFSETNDFMIRTEFDWYKYDPKESKNEMWLSYDADSFEQNKRLITLTAI